MVGAVFLHHDDLVTQTVIAFVFAAFSIQYALFRTHFSASTTILGVATTHATINALGILVSRALLS